MSSCTLKWDWFFHTFILNQNILLQSCYFAKVNSFLSVTWLIHCLGGFYCSGLWMALRRLWPESMQRVISAFYLFEGQQPDILSLIYFKWSHPIQPVMEQHLFEVLTCVNNRGNANALDEEKGSHTRNVCEEATFMIFPNSTMNECTFLEVVCWVGRCLLM